MTVDQLAATTGIDSSNVRAYEAGRGLTGLHALFRLAEALEVQPQHAVASGRSDGNSAPKRTRSAKCSVTAERSS